MVEEQVDVVNENNEVIGQVNKSVAHAQGLLHRCVVSQVINSSGQWILVKQAADRQDAGQFVSPVGGHVSAGEDEVSALKREAMEEMGLEVRQYKKIGEIIFNREVIGRKENHLFLVYEIYSDEPFITNHESVGTEQFAPQELAQQLAASPEKFGDSFHFVIEKLYPELTSR